MPKVSGLIVPKLCHTRPDGNIRCLEPVAPSANHHDYGGSEDEEAQDKEEPEEPLCIMSQIAAIIFLVSFTNFLLFIDKHGINLTDMHLHLCGHPLAFFGKQFLNLMGMILRIASSRIVGTEDVEGCSGCFSLNLSDNS